MIIQLAYKDPAGRLGDDPGVQHLHVELRGLTRVKDREHVVVLQDRGHEWTASSCSYPGGSCLRCRNSRNISSGGTKNGFTLRTPPTITIGCVRRMSITTLAPNWARS